MAAKWQEDKIESALKEAFGEQLDARALWAISMFAKHTHKYCRSNAAFNNFMNRIFPHAHFRQVMKMDKEGLEYEGLEIEIK